MASSDLFENEAQVLAAAKHVLADGGDEVQAYRDVLLELTRNYERMMRQSKRLIDHSDRKELELHALNNRLKSLSFELDYKARHDSLTGTLNRGAIFERAEYHLRHRNLSVIVLDIDYFKSINDEYGHPIGDAVIIEMVSRLKAALGATGEIGRVGGEEFTVLLPELALSQAHFLANQIRVAISNAQFQCFSGRRVTASFGVTWCPAGGDFETAYALADSAMYRAKQSGRNRVEAAPGHVEVQNSCM